MSGHDEDLNDLLFGELDAAARERVTGRLREDADFRAQAERLGPLVQALQGLPAEAWEAVTEPVAGLAPPAPRRPRPGSGRRAPRPVLAGALAACALLAGGIGIGVGLESGGGPASRPAELTVRLAPLSAAAARASGRAEVLASGTLVLDVEHLPRLAAGSYYEAWLMTSATKLVPLASFTVGAAGRARAELRLPASPHAYRYIDISLQRAGGGPAHSAISVLRGAT